MEQNTIALLAMVSGWTVYLYTKSRDSKNDSAEDAKKITEISTKLDVVILNQTETNNRQDASDRDMRSNVERIVVLEQSVKSAHHRIDGLEK